MIPDFPGNAGADGTDLDFGSRPGVGNRARTADGAASAEAAAPAHGPEDNAAVLPAGEDYCAASTHSANWDHDPGTP